MSGAAVALGCAREAWYLRAMARAFALAMVEACSEVCAIAAEAAK